MIVMNRKMPKSCWECFTKLHIEDCPCNDTKVQDYKESRHPDCPIVAEIPDKHGNLKDEKNIEKTIIEYMGLQSINDLTPAERSIFNCICYAPTILEATE